MKILGIETSCDETAVAVVEDGKTILASAMATSVDMHAKTGGIIPEQAAREQVKAMIPTIDQCLNDLESKTGSRDFDAIAVTQGPGLIGSLLIGVETAKALSFAWNKPLVPVNHLVGHIYANFIDNDNPPEFPFVTLVVSGGHTDIMLVKKHGDMFWLGGTRDDAAGEAFDKVARLLDLGYPGGPAIQKAAEHGHSHAFNVPRPMIGSGDYDFSFSGIKTAMRNLVQEAGQENESRISNVESRGNNTVVQDSDPGSVIASEVVAISDSSDTHKQIDSPTAKIATTPLRSARNDGLINDLAASFQEAVVEVLVKKTIKAVNEHHAKGLLLSGGVAANKPLRERLEKASPVPFHCPPIPLCTDNGAMIAAAAFYHYHPVPWEDVQANPGMSLQTIK